MVKLVSKDKKICTAKRVFQKFCDSGIYSGYRIKENVVVQIRLPKLVRKLWNSKQYKSINTIINNNAK